MRILCVALVAVGAAVMLYSVFKYYRSLVDLKNRTASQKLFGDWIYAVCFVMTTLFLIGYAVNIVVYVIKDKLTAQDLLIAGIFFGGAVFVLAMVTMMRRMFEATLDNARLLNAKEEVERESLAKSSFLANMSHELRTPLNAIIGMASIGLSSPDAGRKDYSLKKIDDSSKQLLNVINDILDVSKIEDGGLELSEAEFDFEKILQRVVNVISFRVYDKNQKLTVYVDRDIPKFLIGDDARLSQVLTNLLGNAVKFTPEKGFVSLNTYLLSEENGTCAIKITVTDTGVGISPEQQARLFESFHQADGGMSRKFGGTGLGLVISESIVEMMGGDITVKSAPGKGSAFEFTVRLKRGKNEGDIHYGGVNWERVRVLAVDDDEYILKDLKGIIGRLGAVCDAAASPGEALKLIGRESYDVFFIDWKMPGTDGIALTKTIKAEIRKNGPKTGGYVALMITSAELTAIAEAAAEAGVDKFMRKPLFPSAITEIIAESLAVNENAGGVKSIDGIFKNRTILIAEDVGLNREIAAALLEPTQIAIDFAKTGAEAVDMFKKAPGKYELIFMDVQMPEKDGYEATREIRALGAPEAKTVPIIAMTANVFKEDIENCMSAGMNDHLCKPLDMEKIIETLIKYLRK